MDGPGSQRRTAHWRTAAQIDTSYCPSVELKEAVHSHGRSTLRGFESAKRRCEKCNNGFSRRELPGQQFPLCAKTPRLCINYA